MIATILQLTGVITRSCVAVAVAIVAVVRWDARRMAAKAEREKHADVDQLARRAREMSPKAVRVVDHHDLPTVHEMGI